MDTVSTAPASRSHPNSQPLISQVTSHCRNRSDVHLRDSWWPLRGAGGSSAPAIWLQSQPRPNHGQHLGGVGVPKPIEGSWVT